MRGMHPQHSYTRLRWTGFALLAAAYMLVFFHRMAPGVVASDLMATFNTSAAALGSLAAMYYYIYTVLQIPSGIVADTLGPRYSVGLSGLIAAAGSIIFGLAPDFATASIGRFMVGLGVAFVFVGLMKYNTQWFPARRYGLVSGATLTLGNLGALASAAPLAWTLHWLEWREVFVVLGILGGIISLAILLLLRNRPEDAGLPAINPTAEPSRHWGREMLSVLGNRRLWPGFLGMFGCAGSVFAFAGLWGVPFMTDLHGLSRDAAANYTSMMIVGLALGSLTGGAFSDLVGRRKAVVIVYAAVGLAGWLGLLLAPWQPGLSGYVLFTIIGYSAGGISVIYAAIKETAKPRYSGMAIALVNTGLFLGAAIAQPLFGWLLDLGWDGAIIDGVRSYCPADYQNGLWLLTGYSLLGLIGALALTETYCRNTTED